ncbi:MAG: PspC domain-containing protein [Candidatus Pacebacteria bacterium]|jgi:phage shock protein C|nr:PspC domain-containing protein [Candidatus Paceibacterota bacterium]MDD3072758.1 PspC domain-containing protein [Candidatus Paceibacterota bacterium]MDD3729189.1 PspC domain-containing protein [Candidatus Paceibacterota bacterium]MDD4201712.1 PspC domain-containing protein [Candidatus Paceibacterota bacterium]MDD4467070.1 PspC domain-containing protein [Candidatus Paceibacterota bacterium]
MKKIYRSENNKIFAGIFGGMGEYFDVDPVILRLIAVFICFSTGIFPFIIGYIVACFVVPKKPVS